MLLEYNVYIGSEAVGKVQLKRSGLYLQIDCKCRLSGQVISCLILQSDAERINLGTLVPENGFFALRTSLTAKKLGDSRPHFTIEPKHAEKDGLFIPVCSDEPFAYLQRLSNAYLAARNGAVGIILTEDGVI